MLRFKSTLMDDVDVHQSNRPTMRSNSLYTIKMYKLKQNVSVFFVVNHENFCQSVHFAILPAQKTGGCLSANRYGHAGWLWWTDCLPALHLHNSRGFQSYLHQSTPAKSAPRPTPANTRHSGICNCKFELLKWNFIVVQSQTACADWCQCGAGAKLPTVSRAGEFSFECLGSFSDCQIPFPSASDRIIGWWMSNEAFEPVFDRQAKI